MRLVLVCAFTAACATAPVAEKPTPPAPAPAAAPAISDDDCTLATPLVPGVPGSPGHLLPSDINPNGASELAALMRTMQGELGAAKEAIVQGASFPKMHSRFRKMRCSWPTAPGDRNAQFDALAQVYLAQVQALDARPADLPTAYNNVVQGCVSCHEVSCAGPLEAIEKLRLVESARTP